MLQRIENLYLAILRFVVIAAAGALLVAVGLFGLNSFKGLVSEPEPIKQEPTVSIEDLRTQLKQKDEVRSGQAAEPAEQGAENPAASDVRATAENMAKFVESHSNGEEALDTEKVTEFLSERANSYADRDLDVAYARNLNSSFKSLLADSTAFKAAGKRSPIEFLQSALTAFDASFDNEVKNVDDKNEEAQSRYLRTKSEGMQSLYVAAGAFAAFLTVVFLSIIIRIERNLRNLERLSPDDVGHRH